MNLCHIIVLDIKKECNSALDFKYNIFKFYIKYSMLLDDSRVRHEILKKSKLKHSVTFETT